MNLVMYLKVYFIAFLVFLGIDYTWLAKIAPSFYKKNIGHLMAEKPNLAAAAVFYLLNILGIVIFAVSPALNKNSLSSALILGALYGLFTYATYDLTNYATLRDWPLKVVVVDILWGMFISMVVAGTTYYFGNKLG